MKEHILEIKEGKHREDIERALISRFSAIKRFEPLADYHRVNKLKDGRFGLSNVGFALYSTGYNPRGQSEFAPLGLIYKQDEDLFSLGCFKRENNPEERYSLMIVAPVGKNVYVAIKEITDFVLSTPEIAIGAVYVRFLSASQRDALLKIGFVSIEARPWHPLAAEEDETFAHSHLDLRRIIERSGPEDFRIIDLEGEENKEHRKKSRLAFQRFINFRTRNNLVFNMRKIDVADEEVAKGIIKNHFASLIHPVGSTPQDYFGVVKSNVFTLPDVYAYLGCLNNKPISVFIGEKTEDKLVSIYTSITLRNIEYVLQILQLDPKEMIDNLPELIKEGESKKVSRTQGGNAIALFNQFNYFAKLLAEGIKYVKLGGSETKNLDDQKRQLGATEDKTHWVVKFRESPNL